LSELRKAVIIQTAFPGDVVLTLPVARILKRSVPGITIGFVAIPSVVGLFEGNPSIDTVHIYDKKRNDRGLYGFLRRVNELKAAGYDCAIIPHRSMRSALLARCAAIPRRIGFDTASGKFLMTDVVRYAGHTHEIGRNIALLGPLGISGPAEDPEIPCPDHAAVAVEKFCRDFRLPERPRVIALAPGSVWATKRWPADRYAQLASMLIRDGFSVVMVGGEDDAPLCRDIAAAVENGTVAVAAGQFSLVQSAELLRRCGLLVSNDSAPVHLAAAAHTPVLAIFGPTIPSFGFAPRGRHDRVIQTEGLECRPCSIHGGNKCPTGTFYCMLRITPQRVHDEIMSVAGKGGG
jgi:heptosyltransferase II